MSFLGISSTGNIIKTISLNSSDTEPLRDLVKKISYHITWKALTTEKKTSIQTPRVQQKPCYSGGECRFPGYRIFELENNKEFASLKISPSVGKFDYYVTNDQQ